MPRVPLGLNIAEINARGADRFPVHGAPNKLFCFEKLRKLRPALWLHYEFVHAKIREYARR